MEKHLLKSLLGAYVISCIMLLGLSFLVYKMDITEQMVELGIKITYLLSAFGGGALLGKHVKSRRFLWGAGIGMIYLVLLMCISLGVYHSTFKLNQVLWVFIICVGGGMVGGMISW